MSGLLPAPKGYRITVMDGTGCGSHRREFTDVLLALEYVLGLMGRGEKFTVGPI